MSTIINLEITEFFLPNNLEEEGVKLTFQYNDATYENQWPNPRALHFQNDTQVNMKIIVTLFSQTDSNLGSSELFIYKDSFTKKEKSIKKWLAINNETQRKSVIQTQGAKFAHTVSQIMKMLLKITINYDVKNFTESPAEISSKPVNTVPDSNSILNNMKKASLQGRASINAGNPNPAQEKRQSISAKIMNQLSQGKAIANPADISAPDSNASAQQVVSSEKKPANQNVSLEKKETKKPISQPSSGAKPTSTKPASAIPSDISKKYNTNSTSNPSSQVLLTNESSKSSKPVKERKEPEKTDNSGFFNMSMINMERKSLLLDDSPQKMLLNNSMEASPKKPAVVSSESKAKPVAAAKKLSPTKNDKQNEKNDKNKGKYEQYEKFRKNVQNKIGSTKEKAKVEETIPTEPGTKESRMELIISAEDKAIYDEKKKLTEFQEGFSKTFQDAKLERLSSQSLKKETEDILLKLLEFQTLYHKLHHDQVVNNVRIKELYYAYNERLRSFTKKYNKLREMLESVSVRVSLTTINSEENRKIKEVIRITEKEIDFHRKLLRLKYDETDLMRYRQQRQDRVGNTVMEKGFLVRILENVCRKTENVKKMSLDTRKQGHGILIKNQINIKDLVPEEPKRQSTIQPRASSFGRSNSKTPKQRGSQFQSRKSQKSIDYSSNYSSTMPDIDAKSKNQASTKKMQVSPGKR